MNCDLYRTVIRDFINIFLVIREKDLTFFVKMTKISEKCRYYWPLLKDLQRKIESDETVMRRWNIFGINAAAQSTHRRRYKWGWGTRTIYWWGVPWLIKRGVFPGGGGVLLILYGGGGGATGPKISWGILRVKSRIWRAYWENFPKKISGAFAILRYKDIHCTQTMYLAIAGSTYYNIPYLNRRLLCQSRYI